MKAIMRLYNGEYSVFLDNGNEKELVLSTVFYSVADKKLKDLEKLIEIK